MPDEPKKTNFQAAQPHIPGVPVREVKEHAGTGAMAGVRYLWVAGGGAIVVVIVALVWWAHGATKATISAPVASTPVTAAQPTPSKPSEKLPVAPGPVATVAQMKEPWSTRKFLYRYTNGTVGPALLVHLHGDNYWAFSLREPFGNCELELASVERLRDYYELYAKYPMVGDPCSRTVYDLTRYGSGPNGLVRGAIVAGTGSRPPLAIEVQVEGEKIVASRSESISP